MIHTELKAEKFKIYRRRIQVITSEFGHLFGRSIWFIHQLGFD
jgi:hypothetical protein